MNHPEKCIDAVCEYFKVKSDNLLSASRREPLPLARKILIYLLRELPRPEIAKIVNRSTALVTHYITELNYRIVTDHDFQRTVGEIQSKLEEMTLKLNHSQLRSLYEVITAFLNTECTSVTEELIYLIMDEINEKTRKRIRAEKSDLSMDEKQQRAFIIWHYYVSREVEFTHPHAYMTMLDIIQQLKPEKKRIPILN